MLSGEVSSGTRGPVTCSLISELRTFDVSCQILLEIDKFVTVGLYTLCFNKTTFFCALVQLSLSYVLHHFSFSIMGSTIVFLN